jgi:hypothetical protein
MPQRNQALMTMDFDLNTEGMDFETALNGLA